MSTPANPYPTRSSADDLARIGGLAPDAPTVVNAVDATLTPGQRIIHATTKNGGNITITLPPAALCGVGYTVDVIVVAIGDSSPGDVLIASNAADIGAAVDTTALAQDAVGDSVCLRCNGLRFVVAHSVIA
jgi:hypothetical protein